MNTPINIRVVAMNEKDVFIGVSDGAYCVFSLGDSHEIEIGDILLGDFHGHGASTFAAKNLTRNGSPWIDLEDWESPLDKAIGLFVKVWLSCIRRSRSETRCDGLGRCSP